MREIKFRAWVLRDENEPIWPYMEDNVAAWHDPLGEFEAGNIILMQFTGLRDKNGKEIYEGDIVRVCPRLVENEDAFTAPIVWEGAGFKIDRKINHWMGWPLSYGLDGMASEYEVIGNIYENPELIQILETEDRE